MTVPPFFCSALLYASESPVGRIASPTGASESADPVAPAPYVDCHLWGVDQRNDHPRSSRRSAVMADDTSAGGTLSFTTLALAQLPHLGNARSRTHVVSKSQALLNRYAIAAVIGGLLLQVFAVESMHLSGVLVARLEIDDVDVGAQTEMSGYKFQGRYVRAGQLACYADVWQRKGERLPPGTGHRPGQINRSSCRQKNGVDLALAIGHDGGKTLLIFDLPERPPAEVK